MLINNNPTSKLNLTYLRIHKIFIEIRDGFCEKTRLDRTLRNEGQSCLFLVSNRDPILELNKLSL